MTKERRLQRTRKQVRRLQEESHAARRKSHAESSHPMIELQRQAGNRAVQHLLANQEEAQAATRPSEEEAQRDPKELVKAGEIKIEQPVVEYYDVTGNNLVEVSRQLLQEGKWYEYDFTYDTKVEDDVVTRVDVTISTVLHLPRWTGPGWEQATEGDKAQWTRLLQFVEQDQEDEYEDEGLIPAQWVGVDWEEVPDKVRGEWRSLLQTTQAQEHSRVQLLQRRAMVLQQRLLNLPENQIKEVYDQFLKDLKIEEDAYARQVKFGKQERVSLSTDALLQ